MNPTKRLINSPGNHTVQICLNEGYQADLAIHYIKDGLLNAESVFIIAKRPLIRILRLKMDGLSFDGQALQDPNQIRFFDAQILLLYLQSDDGLEERAFQENLVAPIEANQITYRKVRAFGEMFDILWKQGQHDMLIQLIAYFENLANTESSILCSYTLDHLDPESYEEALESICKYHPHLIPQEDYGSSIEQGTDEALNVFEGAWSRVINKLAH